MRKTFAALGAVALAVTMSLSLAGPAAAKGGGTSGPPKDTKCGKQSQKGILFAFTQFLSAPTAAQKVKYVDNGAALTTVIDQSNTAAQQLGLEKAGQVTSPVGLTIKCTGKSAATFSTDLQFKDTTTGTTAPPLGLKIAGDALLKSKTWLISSTTVCDLTQMESAQYGTACYQAAGLPVPPAS